MMTRGSLLLFSAFATCVLVNCKTATHEKKGHFGDGEHQAEFDKEVLLKDVEDQDNKASKLPPEEQKERLKTLIEKRIDSNHDGFVDRKELQIWTLQAFNAFETEETQEEFPVIDSDDDEKVSWDEYSKDAYGEDFSEETEEFKNPDNDEWKTFVQSYNRDKLLYKAADHDHDGKLDKFEYLAFKHPRFNVDTKSLFIQDILEKSDLDGDGGINLEEFLGDYRKHAGTNEDPDWTIVESDKFKEELDKNKDGLLKGDEIMNWMASDNQQESEEETDHLISECDTNGDSKLTVDEILNNKDLWLESDATDYGKMLFNHDEL